MKSLSMIEDGAGTAEVHLQPGQVYSASHAALVSTVLESGVAVSLWDPIALVGGVNHFILPLGRGPGYANESMPRLLAEMIARGARTSRLVAELFGGARGTDAFTGARSAICAQNTKAALHFLSARSIVVRGEFIGGRHARRLCFHTGTGQSWVTELGAEEMMPIASSIPERDSKSA